MSGVRLLVAAAGSGGHIYPGLAVSAALAERSPAEVVFVGTPSGLESRIVPAHGFHLELIAVPRLRGLSLAGLGASLLGLLPAVGRMRGLMRRFRPDVVFGTGGSVSGVATLAARLSGVRSLILEPNAEPGLATRWSAPFATRVAVAWEATARRRFPGALVSGVPVRAAFSGLGQSSGASGGEVRVLVTGGSQGASRLNRLVTRALPHLPAAPDGLRFTHQTGPTEAAAVRDAYANAGIRAEVTSYIEDMPAAMASSDIVVARAGAITCAEIAAAGRPAVLVPALVAGGHQRGNAAALADAGAAVVFEETSEPPTVAAELGSLIGSRDRRTAMARAAATLVRESPAGRLAAELQRLAEEGSR